MLTSLTGGRMAALLVSALAGFCLLTATASAATYTVTNTVDSSTPAPGSLRAAIEAADSADAPSTIDVPAGTYTLDYGDLDIDNDADVTIVGAGAGKTVIDGAENDRVFAVTAGSTLSVSGATIELGANAGTPDTGYGGLIYNDGTLTVDDSDLIEGSASQGGGAIYGDADASSTTVSDSVVSNDAADASGDVAGAVYVESGSLTLTGDTFANDESYADGAVSFEESYPGDAVTVTGSSFTDNGGTETEGGALSISGADEVTISDSSFSTNTADDSGSASGGALAVFDSGPTSISDSSFDSNEADGSGTGYGGAIYAADDAGLLSVLSSQFSDNEAAGGYGGAIYASSADFAISGSSFTDNQAGEQGGAIYDEGTLSGSSPSDTVTTTSFTGNNAPSGGGGAIYEDSGWLALTDSTLNGNTSASGVGGGLYGGSDEGLTLTNDTIENGSAEDGGGVYLNTTAPDADPITLDNDTVAGNVAQYYGGGIEAAGDANTIEDTIVAENSSAYGYGDCYGQADQTSDSTDAGNNLDSDGTCFSTGGDSTTPEASGDIVDADPLLSGLADNGGSVETDALQSGSPAISAGNSATCAATDARGVSRGSSCDIGAFQTALADLAVSASGPESGSIGTLLTYTFTVTNNGPGDATGVSFSDAVPSEAAYAGGDSSQGSCSGTSTVTCSLGELDAGQSATVTLVLVPATSGSMTQTGSASGTFAAAASGTATTTITALASGNGSSSGSTTAASTSTGSTTGASSGVLLEPVAVSQSATPIAGTKARVNADLDAEGTAATYWFQYGTSTKFGRTTAVRTLRSRGNTLVLTGYTLTGLKRNTRYYFRVVATNANGTTDGRTLTFRTKAKPKPKKK